MIEEGHDFPQKLLGNDSDCSAVKIIFISANATDTSLIHKIHINIPKQFLRNLSMGFSETTKKFITNLAFKRLSNFTKE